MIHAEQNPVGSLQQGSSQPVAAQYAAPIEHPSAGADRMKNFDTHLCITIKWSLDSVRRRSAEAPAAAAAAAVAQIRLSAGDASC